MSRVLIKLAKPIRLTDTSPEVSELNFRTEVVAGDLRGIKLPSLQEGNTDDILKIAGRLCAQPDALMSKLSLKDLLVVLEAVGGFLEDGLVTGTSGSPSSPPPSTSPSRTSTE